MSSVKIKCLREHKWGTKLITGYGEYDISESGIVEVSQELSEKLLEMTKHWEAIKVAKPKAKPTPKKGDLNKDGEVDKKDLEIATAQKEGAEAMVEEAEAKVESVLNDLTKKQLQEVASEMKLDKNEWKSLNRGKLQDYIEKNS